MYIKAHVDLQTLSVPTYIYLLCISKSTLTSWSFSPAQLLLYYVTSQAVANLRFPFSQILAGSLYKANSHIPSTAALLSLASLPCLSSSPDNFSVLDTFRCLRLLSFMYNKTHSPSHRTVIFYGFFSVPSLKKKTRINSIP